MDGAKTVREMPWLMVGFPGYAVSPIIGGQVSGSPDFL